MIQIRPVSDLSNKSELMDVTESKLDEADNAAAASDIRYSHKEVFTRI